MHIAPNALKPTGIFKSTDALPLNINFLSLPTGTSSTAAIFTSLTATPFTFCGHKYFNIVAIAHGAKNNATRPVKISASFLRVITNVILSLMLSLN